MSTIEGIPADVAHVDLDEKRAVLELDATLYPVESLYSAAFVFIDRHYVFLDRPDAQKLRIVVTPKKLEADPEAAKEQLRGVVGELANELVTAAWRHQITQENRARIEAVTLQAMAGSMGPPSLDDLEDFDFTDEAFEDPLGIALSWEEKYAKKGEAKAEASEGTADSPETSDAAEATAEAKGEEE